MKFILLFIMTCLLFLVVLLCTSSVIAQDYSKERTCLAEAIYYEARSESFEGKLAVANVVIERLKRKDFPNTICKVVHNGIYWKNNIVRDKCAFSYYCDGKHERMLNSKAKQDAYNMADLALNGVELIDTVGCTHYHAVYVRPTWIKEFSYIIKVGHHLFYRKD
jgi:spore germination cell wall hydrolase CwlJ-like protein